MSKIRNDTPKRRCFLVRPSGPHGTVEQQIEFSAQAKRRRVSTSSRPLPVALTSGTRDVKPNGCGGGEAFELMEGAAVCTWCRKKGSTCFRTGSTKRGRGRPAKHPVVVGTTIYGRCESCKSANVTCTTIAPTGRAPIPTLPRYQPPKRPEPEHPASPPVAGPGPSTIRQSLASGSGGTAATVDPKRSPFDGDPLWEDVNAGVKDTIISIAHSIATLKYSLDQLNDISRDLGQPEYYKLPCYSPQAQMPARKARDIFNKPNNTVGNDILPPIQEAITGSNTSIHHFNGLLAVRPLLPPIIDSDYESDDELW
ncbi:hypothetical protein FA13DRAFT_1712402 [Coprinellus micaceus]|uniref:Uncharacterized protein n=1 Tax=Coprinellus micaceus TaxID=71717 RepID=A0A4Y7T0K9_COPMI|nr:hypothetical protein FA13DRAFT_1712402 [Coprinellus micaceus]